MRRARSRLHAPALALAIVVGVGLAVVGLPTGPARADAPRARALPRADSASPDAPLWEWAYGPRAAVALGGEAHLFTHRGERSTLRVGALARVGVEDALGGAVLPSQSVRTTFEAGAAWALGDDESVELGASLGRRSAFTTTELRLPDPPRPGDVPFGAGGWYVALDAAARTDLSARVALTSRVTARLYTNLFPELVGRPVESDHVADVLGEGATASFAPELHLRWRVCPGFEPQAALYTEAVEPHDDNAHRLWLARALLAFGVPLASGELAPFVFGEAGHGQGILVNRSELRLGGGVRWHAR